MFEYMNYGYYRFEKQGIEMCVTHDEKICVDFEHRHNNYSELVSKYLTGDEAIAFGELLIRLGKETKEKRNV